MDMASYYQAQLSIDSRVKLSEAADLCFVMSPGSQHRRAMEHNIASQDVASKREAGVASDDSMFVMMEEREIVQ